MHHDLAPGVWVVSPDRPDWGLGQVQSAVGDRVTANFEHMPARLWWWSATSGWRS